MTLSSLVSSSANIFSKGTRLTGDSDYDVNPRSMLVNTIKKKGFGNKPQATLSHSLPDAIRKPFGEIYYNNKVVLYDEDLHIIEIRMTMGTKTETAYDGYHVVRLAIYNPDGVVYDSLKDLYKAEISNIKSKRKGGPGADPQKDMAALRKAMKGQPVKDGSLPESDSEKFEVDAGELLGNLTGFIIPVADTSRASMGQSFAESGKVFYLRSPITPNSLVRVSCTCSDYYYTISPYNYKAGAHLGPKPTFPSTSNKVKPVRNQQKNPGLCKHLMMMVVLLLNGGILSGANSNKAKYWRDLVVNRSEKLVVPKKLTDENELRRMYAGVNDTINTVNYQRKNQAQQRKDFNIWKSVTMAANSRALRSGTRTDSIGKGVSYKGMRNDYANARAFGYNDEYKELSKRIYGEKMSIEKAKSKNKFKTNKIIQSFDQAIKEIQDSFRRQTTNRGYMGSRGKNNFGGGAQLDE